MKNPQNPWAYFFIFLLSNLVITAAPIPVLVKASFAMLGIFLPLILFFRRLPEKTASLSDNDGDAWLPSIPPWLGASLFFFAVFARFYRLSDFMIWPKEDEGIFAFSALHLMEKWDWKFFYFSDHHSPTYIWALVPFLQLFQSPLLAMRLLPAVISILVLPLSYFAFRSYFSRSLSLIGVCIAGSYLWLLGCGRWSQASILITPWELACLGLLGMAAKEKDGGRKEKISLLLALILGLGYWSFPSWPFVVLLIGFTYFWLVYGGKRSVVFPLLKFSLFFILGLLPFLIASWRDGFDPLQLVRSGMGNGASLYQRILAAASYFTSLWWGPLKGVGVYDSDNLERLNPIWGSIFFVGITRMLLCRSEKIVQWVFWAFLAFSLPAWLSMYVEMFRTMTMIPLMLLVTAWGVAGLLITVPFQRRWLVLSLLLASGAVWDCFRIYQLHPESFARPTEAVQTNFPDKNLRLFRLLKEASLSMGPGLIFTEFKPEFYEVTLLVASYPFNAAVNPGLEERSALWAGVVTNLHYQRFLSARFPGAHWVWVDRDLPGEGETMLGVIPLTQVNRGEFDRWIEAHRYFRRLTEDIYNINGLRTYGEAAGDFANRSASIQGDRFLESCYWEKYGEFFYRFDFKNHYPDLVDALEKAIHEGYPSAHLNYKLGSLYLRKRNFSGARNAFEAALKTEPQYAEAATALKLLGQLEKEQP